MSDTPLMLYQLFLDNDQQFNVHAQSTSILTSMVRSRFIGREHGLLVLERPFKDLADRSVATRRKQDRATIELMFFSACQSDVIVVINTHASPQDGGLLYGAKKTTSLEAIINRVLGDDFPTSTLRRSVLFILCCGGFVQHSLGELRAMSKRFSAVFAFGAPILDPILVTSQFVTSIVDYYIFGQESLLTATMRALKQEVMKHTTVYIGSEGAVKRVVDAPWRRKPNGIEIRCCQQVPKYMGTDRNGQIKFRCRVPSHTGRRTFRVEPLSPLKGIRQFWGRRGGSRYMLSDC
ncbi:hypothetical protein C8Q76DRAFT_616816 [Earliella scabrosa]|nr:hypothetical protein C8Q76DRAFT_616816 [Earliella scabrosa]